MLYDLQNSHMIVLSFYNCVMVYSAKFQQLLAVLKITQASYQS